MTTTNKNTELLTVNFYKIDAGWLYFKISIGRQTFDSVFSAVFDPMLDLKQWLEAISIGVQQASFTYNPEGTVIKFDFEKINNEKEVFTISDIYGDEKCIIKAEVDRGQIVKAFYLGLLNFARSDKFKSKEWEIEYMEERMCKLLKLNKLELIDYLIDMERAELIEILFQADPLYTVSYPSAKDKTEELKLFIENKIQGGKLPDNHKSVEERDELDIPKDFNYWTKEKKITFINECLKYPTNGYHGTKIKDFRSKIIEGFLESK